MPPIPSVPAHVVVVGASAAGLCTVEALRRAGHVGRITLVGEELHTPYDRPPLSKQVLAGTWDGARAALRTAEGLAALEATFLLGDTAVGIDIASRTVHTASGRALAGDAIVIATGASARRLPGQAAYAGAHVLRTLDDTLVLRRSLLGAARVVVVGEGVLGCEIAATASTLGVDVTLTGPLAAPMIAQLGPLVGGLLGEAHEEHGVHLRLGASVVRLRGEAGRVTGVELANGDVLPADVVAVAIGATPATHWLAGSGLRLEDGVVCDARCQAADGIYAVGDVARWYHEDLRRHIRLENRTNANEQAIAVAAAILGGGAPYVPVPYFWTDQLGIKIQVFGEVTPDAEVAIVDGDVAERRFVARYSTRGVVTAVVGWNMPKQVRQRRQEVADGMKKHVPNHEHAGELT